jgi:hypothetical protein
VLVLGILSIPISCICVGLVLAIVALSLAPGARREIQASQGTLRGEGQLKAGIICSWVGIGLFILWGVVVVVGRLGANSS